MHLRSLSIALACCALAWGGYELSHLRARQGGGALPEVLAAAGGEGAQLLADASGGIGSRGYRISSLSVFSNVALHVKDNYVEPSSASTPRPCWWRPSKRWSARWPRSGWRTWAPAR
jgi:hypothetical protein